MQIELKPSDFFKRRFDRITQGESFSFDIPNYYDLSELTDSERVHMLKENLTFILKMDCSK